jgi:hypothetical protein
MNVIIPERQRILNPKARPTIRAMISRCAAEVLIAEFGFGGNGERLERIESAVDARLKKYSGYYSRYRNERRAMEALREDALNMGIDCDIRPGSGEKVLVGHEHDMIFMSYLIVLHELEGFANKRMDRFQAELQRKIRYYNSTFDGAPDMVVDVMDDRLGRCGKEQSAHFAPVKQKQFEIRVKI